MRILAIDTALDTCAACVMAEGDETPISTESLPMARGHAESLLPLIERVIALLAHLLAETIEGSIAAAIDARHGALYVQALSPGGDGIAPAHLPVADVADRLIGAGPVLLAGSGSPALAAALAERGVEARVSRVTGPDIASVAALGLLADPEQALPRPLYLRGPDARPQDHARIARQ